MQINQLHPIFAAEAIGVNFAADFFADRLISLQI
jgi:hypothetical protein